MDITASKVTHAFWLTKQRKHVFCLCVDDFGKKYHSLADANRLINISKQQYKVSIGWTRKNYSGLNINWNYEKNTLIFPWTTTSPSCSKISAPTPVQALLHHIHVHITKLWSNNPIQPP